MTVLEPIARKSAESLALDRLRAAILSGGLAAGARLTETTLADQLATSRATVRTALHHLVAEGLAVQVPYTGWMVTSLTANDAWELVTLRASFESLAASLAAERATPEARAGIDHAFAELTAASKRADAAAATHADFAFHKAIVAAAGHERLAEHYRRVEQQIRMLIASSNALSPPMGLTDQHQPIYRAIIEGDVERAGQHARLHIETEGQRLVERLRGPTPPTTAATSNPQRPKRRRAQA
jgi:DNA-binding GntR family transcriptional regulator